MRYVKGKVEGGAVVPPAELADLLERPLVASVATIRPDGSMQNNPMWFSYDGTVLLLSHTVDRQKTRNLQANPAVSLCITDPDNTYRYIEVRGVASAFEADVGAEFHRSLRDRYGMDPTSIPDADRRIIITVTPTFIGGREMEDPSLHR